MNKTTETALNTLLNYAITRGIGVKLDTDCPVRQILEPIDNVALQLCYFMDEHSTITFAQRKETDDRFHLYAFYELEGDYNDYEKDTALFDKTEFCDADNTLHFSGMLAFEDITYKRLDDITAYVKGTAESTK